MNQLSIFDGIKSEKFPQYHKDNPHIYEAFKHHTHLAISRGFKNFSAEFVFNILRWETGISAKHDPYKINNNYKAFYSRMFMNEYPEYANFFRVRKSKFD